MKISSIVDITGGKLLNSPAISFTTQAHTNLKKVSDGDLFISSNIDEIKEAIKKGAFGIVFDFDIDVSIVDNEIAWIKVDDINRAITKLLRFKLANLPLKSYAVDFIAYEFLSVLAGANKNIYFINDIFSSFELLQDIEKDDILISTNHRFLSDIYPKSEDLQIENIHFENLLIHSIFETSFLYNDEYFYKLRIPYIYLNHLLSIKKIFNLENLDTNKLKNIQFMHPTFINKQNQIVDYGKSNRFILTAQNEEISKIEFDFINIIFKYGKTILFDCNGKSDDEIFLFVSQNSANCIYLANQTNEKIVEILKLNERKEQTLF
ncbi:MAG: peptidoglycan synthetase [Arcobacteraceae bacterium]|jgi:ferrochelatase|nr:peptidoglycan synthetase [Arcobacteraceae bacterium]